MANIDPKNTPLLDLVEAEVLSAYQIPEANLAFIEKIFAQRDKIPVTFTHNPPHRSGPFQIAGSRILTSTTGEPLPETISVSYRFVNDPVEVEPINEGQNISETEPPTLNLKRKVKFF